MTLTMPCDPLNIRQFFLAINKINLTCEADNTKYLFVVYIFLYFGIVQRHTILPGIDVLNHTDMSDYLMVSGEPQRFRL